MTRMGPETFDLGDRVLFEEDGNWVTGTVIDSERYGMAVLGDLGGVHSGPLLRVLAVADIIDHFYPDD